MEALLPAIASLLGLLGTIAGWFANKQKLDAGKAEERAASLEKERNEEHKADAAREAAHALSVTDPSSVMRHDGFERAE